MLEMISFYMEAYSIFGTLIIAMVTIILNTFMYRLNMNCQMMLLCSLIVTLITSILETFMYRLNMFSPITLVCKLSVTLITCILDTFMCRLNMSCQINLSCKLFVTLIISILDTFMYGLDVAREPSSFRIWLVTLFTLKYWFVWNIFINSWLLGCIITLNNLSLFSCYTIIITLSIFIIILLRFI